MSLCSRRGSTHLRENPTPERRGDPAYPPGEANALAWVLNVVEEAALKVRVERVERQLRVFSQRVSVVETALAEEEEDDAATARVGRA